MTFDCYGTLIDWERGIGDTFRRLWPRADANALLARYHAIEPEVQSGSGAPYYNVLTEVLTRVADTEGLALSADEGDALARSLPDWPPFPEVPTALAAVRDRGWHIAILSNTDPDLLDASVRRIGVEPDLRITASEAGSYKPAPGHWERFREETGAQCDHHVHVAASLFHDIEPAHRLGIPAIWINRSGEKSDVPRGAELPDLARLPEIIDAVIEGLR